MTAGMKVMTMKAMTMKAMTMKARVKARMKARMKARVKAYVCKRSKRQALISSHDKYSAQSFTRKHNSNPAVLSPRP